MAELDVCMYGSCYKKPTKIFISSSKAKEIKKVIERKCDGGHDHEKCYGRDIDGINHSVKAACYPDALLRTFCRITNIINGSSTDKGKIVKIEQRIATDVIQARQSRRQFVEDYNKYFKHMPRELAYQVNMARIKLKQYVQEHGFDFELRKTIPPEDFVQLIPPPPPPQ